ncbi:chitinase [soil metagenome]
MINRKFFFEQVRATLYTGKLSASQVAGLTHILDVWEAKPDPKDDRWLAYALGTAHHETAFTMQPIREIGGANYFFKIYDPKSPLPARAKLAKSMGALPGDGVLFYGRGYVQLTWRSNYAKMQTAFGTNLTANAVAADGALEPGLAARIMFKGMTEGTFTGRKLSQYFNATMQDWVNARRIINGLDCADKIAVYARGFYAAISYTV